MAIDDNDFPDLDHQIIPKNPVGHPVEYRPYMGQMMLPWAMEGLHVSGVCVKFGITETTFYNWIERYPEFKEAYDQFKVLSVAYHESIGHKALLGEIPHFNAKLYQFIMTNKYRHMYVNTGGPTEITINNLTTVPLETLLEKSKEYQEKLGYDPRVLDAGVSEDSSGTGEAS